MANQVQVVTTAHRTDKPGDPDSGLAPARALLQVPQQDTWPETEQVAHAVVLTDRTAEAGEAARAQAHLHHRLQDTKVLVLALPAADKISLS